LNGGKMHELCDETSDYSITFSKKEKQNKKMMESYPSFFL